MIKVLLLSFTLGLSFCCTLTAQKSILEYVNPFIGTGGHGHTFPGATAPFGMMQLSPDTRLSGWDGCSGYHYTDTTVYGFSHTHLSGTGVSDYGDLLLMPFTGKIQLNNGSNGEEGYVSTFKKENEVAQPGYYRTLLEEDNISVELSTTLRAGMHQYTFNEKTEEQQLLIDLVHRDKVLEAHLEIVSPTEIIGFRKSDAWAREQAFYFVLEFNKPIIEPQIYINDEAIQEKSATDQHIKASLNFGPSDLPLKVRVGISAVDIAGAKKNLAQELSHWEAARVKQEAEEMWLAELSKIKIKTNVPDERSEDKMTIFYTSLYHTMIAPNIFSDVDGRYRGTDLKIHQAPKDHIQYTVFSLWDTYRAAHPLYTIIDQKRTKDYINTFLNQYKQGGSLPMWELAGNYTGCMIGYHAVPVISDAFMKGIDGFDTALALEAMIAASNADELGKQYYKEHSLLTTEEEPESVSKTLEYAYDDWTIARMAEKLGRPEISDTYYQRSQNYKNVFDPTTGFMRARANNRWFHPFDAAEVNFNYTEANSWQYSFYFPHDVDGWIDMIGGPKSAEKKLDELFTASSATLGRHQVDITGLIGQYAHGNEPSHHIAYLYNFTGSPHKTQKYTRQIMNELYFNAPDGLSGNEDCGQMSAWLIMSALGFYPVTPGSNDYIIGSPWFDEVSIELENGNTITIEAENNSEENIYIQNMTLDNELFDQTYLTHQTLMAGAHLHFKMGPEPNFSFGSYLESIPISNINGPEVVATPALITGDRSFKESTMITLESATKNATIHYSLNKNEVQIYTEPFIINRDTKLTTWATAENGIDSAPATSHFIKLNKDRQLNLLTDYASQYAAGGHTALIDKVRGGTDYRNGNWQGYEGVNLEAVINLGHKKEISEIRVGFLQDENSWIFMPTQVDVYVGQPGNWKLYGNLINDSITPKDTGAIIRDFVVRGKSKSQYILVLGRNRGTCPEGHKGAGGKAWIFSDEIVVK